MGIKESDLKKIKFINKKFAIRKFAIIAFFKKLNSKLNYFKKNNKENIS
jgi:hypothetical protein